MPPLQGPAGAYSGQALEYKVQLHSLLGVASGRSAGNLEGSLEECDVFRKHMLLSQRWFYG